MGTMSAHFEPLVRIAEIGGNTLRDIELHGASAIDKIFFVDPNDVIAQWSNKLFLIAIDQPKVTPLPSVPGELRIDPSGKVLVSQQDSLSRLYRLPSLQPTASLDSPSSGRLRPAAGAGKLLAFEANQPPSEFFVDIWSVVSKARVSHVPLPAELTHLAFNPSGTILFTAESENLPAWDMPSGKRRFSLTASGDVDQIVPDPSSASFSTITHGQLTVWDAVTGARLAQLPDAGHLRAAALSPDGRYVLAGYEERSAALWLWRSSDLRDQGCARLTHNLSRDEWERWFPKQPYRQICANLPPAN
jgi:WD40 repeat protein